MKSWYKYYIFFSKRSPTICEYQLEIIFKQDTSRKIQDVKLDGPRFMLYLMCVYCYAFLYTIVIKLLALLGIFTYVNKYVSCQR